MNKRSYSHLCTPIIGRCVELNDDVLRFTTGTMNSIKHPYVDVLKSECATLFKYARRQVAGGDYHKRATDLLEDIQSNIYLIFVLGGLSKKQAMTLDVLCDEIYRQVDSMKFAEGQNV